MSWRSAVVGAILGLIMLRHPMGILIGAAVGYFLGPKWESDAPKRSPARMLYPLFALAGALAKADGRVSEAEVEAAEHWMARLDLTRKQRRQAITAFDAGKQNGFDAAQHARELAAHCVVRLDLKLMLIGALHQIAGADGSLHADAAQLHQRIREWMEVPDDLWQQARARFDQGGVAVAPEAAVATTSDYHLLGVGTQASDAEIRRAYRRLLTRHHPDKLAWRDAPAAEKRIAEERTRNLIAAYERIKTTRGMK
jgi:DnaJ like chaperone protein